MPPWHGEERSSILLGSTKVVDVRITRVVLEMAVNTLHPDE